MRKFRFCLMAVLCVAGLTFASCGGDDDEPESTEQGGGNSGGSGNTGGSSTGKNPVSGKTFSCVESSNDGYMKISTNFKLSFTAKNFTRVMKQTAESKDIATGKWELIQNLDKTETGTYEYTADRIVLHPSDGGSVTLTKSGNGWKDGNYIYK